ncbi:hypothetical protein PILCRDRAFT_813943 [Piloderma croceum F 1598]|uniref:DUF4419 domain-containing protein n=1 Tax=Piloderma croceum (strain F 1598) TaxID=765440 RepID=A0A0C3CGQ1_PILCF|nr:hypothetical protein PILCRDRAFT_813943 [Piloderma croceum F 1598]
MPVTFQPAKHQANIIPPPRQLTEEPPATQILRGACYDQFKKCGEIFQSSLDQKESNDSQNIIPYRNGFVHTVIQCYNKHNALVIRPDDVWLAVLTQFNFFVNGNAEQLRKQFVSHEGKKELEIKAMGTRHTVDFGFMARQMTNLIDENIVDPALRAWILPDFSTTTDNDVTVSSIVMMATLKAYFSYKMTLMCGIPRVTLEGEKEDWEKILTRLEKLKEYGDKTTAWYHLLVPVISRFVRAFDGPDAEENIDFWQKVAHYQGGGSGPRWIAGWINAFCVFDEKGKWIGHRIGQTPEPPNEKFARRVKTEHYLTLDGIIYHRTDTNDVPSGFAEVDVKLDDNGQKFDTVLTAGLVGARICDSEDKSLSSEGKRDTARPVVAWWIFAKKDVVEEDPFGGRF